MRNTDPGPALARLLGPEEAAQAMRHVHRPQYLVLEAQRQLDGWRRAGRFGDILFDAWQRQLDAISTIQGGCERIAGTPIPYAYSVLLHRTTYFYCALLPFGLVDSIGGMTPVIAVFIAYAFMALDAIASELENPFGEEPNDLPLEALAVNIERMLLEGVDAGPLPAPTQPDRHYRLR
ncbi:hypothetical protein GCM10023144_41690 [Pigmentiphaga soli]|uniref:Bestrophin, RFP-TM, chloride channel n=1 Tax=Pigmentiphaga soli TaxID=1007095 RepID=A0ABP8HM18_9BURK